MLQGNGKLQARVEGLSIVRILLADPCAHSD